MAPVVMQALGWTAASSLSPELILASLLCLVALVKLLTICSQCNREAFELREPSQTEKSPTSLIRVINLEDAAMSTENPCFEYVAKDVQVPSPTPQKGSTQVSMGSVVPSPTPQKGSTQVSMGSVVPSPTPQKGSTQVSMESGEVWYTPWRSHTNSLNHRDHLGNSLNHELNPAASPAHAFAGVPAPSGVSAAPLQEGVSMWLPSAHSETSSHPRDAPVERLGPLWRSETRQDDRRVPDSSAGSVPQHRTGAQHTYESLEDLGAADSEEGESHDYQTVDELNASVPYLSDSTQRAGPDLLSAPNADEGAEEGMITWAMYAQVSKKCKNPAQPPCTLPEGEERVPLPRPLLEDEAEPAPPPVPDRTFEM